MAPTVISNAQFVILHISKDFFITSKVIGLTFIGFMPANLFI
jgi:hypothetical protein